MKYTDDVTILGKWQIKVEWCEEEEEEEEEEAKDEEEEGLMSLGKRSVISY